MSYRIAVVTTHPIQYHAPWFRGLEKHPDLDSQILFCHEATAEDQSQAGFGVTFSWDMPILEGYRFGYLKNVAANPSLGKFSGLDTPEISELISSAKFDAVIINGWHYKSAWQAMRACWKTRTPVMVRSDSHLHTERPFLKRIAKEPFYSWFISKLDACLPVGRWSSDYFLHYGAAPERLFIVPHVVDTDYFQGESQQLGSQRGALRKQWGLDETAVVFVFAGKFTSKKRPLDFVNAIGQARSGGARVEGLMVGDGPLRVACEELARKENLPITFAGFLNQSEIAQAYVAADALVLPSDGGETWGLVVNEAMACGRPCFVSDRVGCGPDMITPGETGGIFPIGDTAALGVMLSEFATNREQRDRMGKRAAKQSRNYTPDVAVDGTVAAVEAVSR